MTILARARVILEGDTVALTKSLRGAEAAMTQAGRRMNAIGKSMSMKLTLPIVAVGVASIKAFADFDDAMNQSIAIMGDVSDTMRNKMEEAAKDVARTTTIGAKKAAESYFFLASAGLNAAQSIAALPQVARFAQAGMFNMATATDLATDAQSALGLTVDDTQQNLVNLTRVTDVLVGANTLANASVIQFAEALTREAGAALKTFNIDIEEGVAVLAAFADQGVKSMVAGSGLARILRLLSAAATQHEDALRKLGIAVFDDEEKIRNLADIIEDMENAFSGMTDKARTAALETIGFTARVQGILLPLLGTSGAIREYNDKLDDMGGITREVSDKQLESFKSQLKLVWNQIVLAANAAGKTMAPAVAKLGAAVKEAALGFEEMNEGLRITILVLGGLVAVIGPSLLVVGGLTLGISKLVVGLRALIVTAGGATRAMWLLRAVVSPGGALILGLGVLGIHLLRLKIAAREAAQAMRDANAAFEEKLGLTSAESATKMLEALNARIAGMKERLEVAQRNLTMAVATEGMVADATTNVVTENQRAIAVMLDRGRVSKQQAEEEVADIQATIDQWERHAKILGVVVAIAQDIADEERLAAASQAAAAMAASVREAVDELKAVWNDAITANELFGDSFNLAEEQASILESGILDLITAGAVFDEVVGPNGETLQELAIAYLKLTGEIDAATASQDALTAAQDEAKEIIQSILTPTQIYDQTILRLNEHLDKLRLTQGEYDLAVAQAKDTLATATKEGKKWGTVMQRAANNVLRSFTDFTSQLTMSIGAPTEATKKYNRTLVGLERQLELGKITQAEFNEELARAKELADDARISFSEFIGSVIKDLQRLATEAALRELFQAIIKTAAGAAAGGGEGGGGSGGGDAGGQRHGGFIPEGQFSLVGEAGPEVIHAGRGGLTVAPMRGMEFSTVGGGPSPQVSVHITAVDAKSFTELAEANPGAIVGPFLQALQRSSLLQGALTR